MKPKLSGYAVTNTVKWAWPFAAVLFWMGATLFDGFLLSADAAQRRQLASICYVTFTSGCFLLTLFISVKDFCRFSYPAAGTAILLTALYPFLPTFNLLLLGLLGFIGSFLFIKGIISLRESPHPYLSVVISGVLSHILIFILFELPVAPWLKFSIVALALAPIPFTPSPEKWQRGPKEFIKYLPIVFLFFMVAAAGRFSAFTPLTGMEFLGLALAVGGGIWLYQVNREYPLALGVIFCMLAFSFHLLGKPIFGYLSQFNYFIAVGLIYFPILWILIDQDSFKAVGYGSGTQALGLLCAMLITLYLPAKLINSLLALGQVLLLLSIFMLYFLGKKREKISSPGEEVADKPPRGETNFEIRKYIEERFQKKLSEQEKAVVELVLQGKTYRETAILLGISQGSVKTYMRRICEKLEVYHKTGLIEKLTLKTKEKE